MKQIRVVLCLCALWSPALAWAKLAATPSFTYTTTGGARAVTAGDLNNDGYSDLAVAVTGQVLVFFGSATGLEPTPSWQINIPSATSYALAVAALGDVSGDHVDDLIVGDPQTDPVTPHKGRAFVYLGATDLKTRPDGSPASADWVADANASPNGGTIPQFGFAVATAGDLDNDGVNDIVVGAPFWDYAAGYGNGRAFVWLGSGSLASGPDGTPENAVWFASGASAQLGHSVGSAGDMNGDGFADLVAGGPDYAVQSGIAAVFFGQSPFANKPLGTTVNADRVAIGVLGDFDSIGQQVGEAGDVDGDGHSDLLVAGYGPAAVYAGGGSVRDLTAIYSTTETQVLSTAGDVNGDGLADFAVGGHGIGTQDKFDVVFGRLAGALPPFDESRTPVPTAYNAYVFTAGDVNGDGYSDLASVAYGAVTTLNVFTGGGYPTEAALGNVKFGSPSGGFGISAGAAGDVDADGYSDYVAGEPGWAGGLATEGRFQVVYGGFCGPFCHSQALIPTDAWEGNQTNAYQGWSVAGAGDVNGDGYDDVVVGAPLFDSGTHPDAGRIQIYLGGYLGLAFTPSFTLEGQDGDGAQLGFKVAGAGDVNGDGRGDVLVAAPYASPGGVSQAGRVYLFLGADTPQGVDPVPAWTKSGTGVGQHLGITLASAGDVNCNGRSDAIVVAVNAGPAGEVTATVYAGAATGGFEPSPLATLVGAQPVSDYGISVASAGDVNGDACSDVVMGEPEFAANQGRVRVFHGGLGGLSTTAATTLARALGDTRFGSGVGGGGDVDGDGYGDIVVGEQWRSTGVFADGAAHVYLGGPAGLSTTEARELIDTPGDNSDLGRDVALNLDVNGDGFADVLAGAIGADPPGYPGTNYGGVYIHFGGGARGVSRVLRMNRFAALTPLALRGKISDSEAVYFRIRSTLRSAAGRIKVRSEVESNPLSTSLNGIGAFVNSNRLDSGVTGVDFAGHAVCQSGQTCHWRMRVRSDDPLFPKTRWFSLPGIAPTEAAVRAPVDGDGDGFPDGIDVCPQQSDNQTDADLDGTGDACDSCRTLANPRVAASFLAANPWATLTGQQRDDDHDGYGNKCDAKFPGVTGVLVGPGDLAQFRAANGKNRSSDTCGPTHTRPCAIYDLDEASTLIGAPDLSQFRLLNGKAPGPKCTACPLTCSAGTAGTCGVIP